MKDIDDLTDTQVRVVEYLRSCGRATFDQIEAEVEFGTESAEELIKNLQHKEIIHQKEVHTTLGGFDIENTYYELRSWVED